jgi:hypothetical protein
MDNINCDGIPKELKQHPNWVNWTIEIREGKPTKPPINPKTGDYAQSDNPLTWGTYEQALNRWKECENDAIEGIGFMFSDGRIGIDLDKCRNAETGEVEGWAKEIIERINSYSEISPSGTGIHTIVNGVLPSGQRKKGKIEMYDKGRYFTVTGWHLEGTPLEIQQRDKELKEVHSQYLSNGKKSSSSSHGNINPSSSDLEIIEKAKQASNGDKFQKLWSGDWSEYPSQSEADLALCQILAFWTNKDHGKIDQLFRQSGLIRSKWDQRHYGDGATYGEKTIQTAIERTTEVYQSQKQGDRNKTERNLTEEFRMWIEESYGSFTIDQIYRDLGVTNQKEKNVIRVNLHREFEKGTVEKGRVMGAYFKIDQEITRLEILEAKPTPLQVTLPGSAEEYVEIYSGNIIAIAGAPNQGKTAFCLNTAYDNRNKFEVIYFSSEMGSDELTLRTSKFNVSQIEWKKIQFIKRTHDFHQVIKPNALNIVDYLEVIEGEFFKIGDNIRRIFEKLQKGIAIVALQMDRGAKFAWGGQKTLDKARLYLTLDNNKMTIVKGKNRASDLNPNGLVSSFKLINGSKFLWNKWERAW